MTLKRTQIVKQKSSNSRRRRRARFQSNMSWMPRVGNLSSDFYSICCFQPLPKRTAITSGQHSQKYAPCPKPPSPTACLRESYYDTNYTERAQHISRLKPIHKHELEMSNKQQHEPSQERSSFLAETHSLLQYTETTIVYKKEKRDVLISSLSEFARRVGLRVRIYNATEKLTWCQKRTRRVAHQKERPVEIHSMNRAVKNFRMTRVEGLAECSSSSDSVGISEMIGLRVCEYRSGHYRLSTVENYQISLV